MVSQFDVSTLNLASAMGISVLVSFSTNNGVPEKTDTKERERERVLKVFSYGVVRSIFALVFGWIALQLM
jgi:hypothetical protein